MLVPGFELFLGLFEVVLGHGKLSFHYFEPHLPRTDDFRLFRVQYHRPAPIVEVSDRLIGLEGALFGEPGCSVALIRLQELESLFIYIVFPVFRELHDSIQEIQVLEDLDPGLEVLDILLFVDFLELIFCERLDEEVSRLLF